MHEQKLELTKQVVEAAKQDHIYLPSIIGLGNPNSAFSLSCFPPSILVV